MILNIVEGEYFYKYQVDGFPIILSVAKGSPAYNAGLLKNDIILEINKKNTQNFRKKLLFILENKKWGDYIILSKDIIRHEAILLFSFM